MRKYLNKNTEIVFQGNDYIIVAGDLETGGPIATEEQYENFECSFAHLFPNGDVLRFQEKIGTRDDILLKEKEVKIEAEGK